MKHVYAVVFSMLALCSLSRAQFVADNSMITTTAEGSANSNEGFFCPLGPAPAAPWQKQADQVFGHIRGSLLARLKNTSEDLIWLFHDSILNEGSFHPIWHGEYFSAGNGAPQLRFGVSCVFHSGDMEHSVDMEHSGDENTTQSGDLTLFANDISPLVGSLTVNGQTYVTLKGFTGNSPGFEFDVPANGEDEGATVHVKAWLVTPDSSVLPYIPVTRKEYLGQARQELEARKTAIVADLKSRMQVRPAAEQDALKQQALDQLRATYSGTELETRTRIFLNNYKTDETYAEQHIAAATEGIDRPLSLIEKLLTGSTAAQLALPAVVSVPSGEFSGFEDGKAGCTVLVRMRGDYYGGDSEQVKSLLICWRYHPHDKTAAGIDRELSTRNPVPVLRKQFHNASLTIAK
jgi:hypothetical protein